MTGNRIARVSLRLDAVYCIVLGIIAGAAAPMTAGSLGIPASILVVVGAGTAAWGVFVWFAARAQPLRQRTRLVMVANIVASIGLAATGLVGGTAALSVAALILAVDVAAFAASQGVALRLMRRTAA